MRHENKVNENKILSYWKALRCETLKNNKKLVSLYVKLTNFHHFELDFQQVDQHSAGKWLIHGTLWFRNLYRRYQQELHFVPNGQILTYAWPCVSNDNDNNNKNNDNNNDNNNNNRDTDYDTNAVTTYY